MKVLVLGLLGALVGFLINLLSTWIEPKAGQVLGPERLLFIGLGIVLVLLIGAAIELAPPRSWNSWWHHFWYLRDLHQRPLRAGIYAPLELKPGHRRLPGAEIVIEDTRRDLVTALREILVGARATGARILVLGEPGAGKSTALQQLTWDLARHGVRRLGIGQRLPVFVPLARFESGPLLDLVRTVLGEQGTSGRALAQRLEQLVAKGRIVLLFDGLDEALGPHREPLLHALDALLRDRAYLRASLILMSRTRDEPGRPLLGVPVFVIQELSDAAVATFVTAAAGSPDKARALHARLAQFHLLDPGGLGRNPFWLTLILGTEVFSGNRGQVLNQAVDVLLGYELRKPKTERTWHMVLPVEEQRTETKRCLAHLAYHMAATARLELDLDTALAEAQASLVLRPGLAALRPQDALALGRDAQLLVYEEGKSPLYFRHRLLQEFLVAYALANDSKLCSAALAAYAEDPAWWETFLLLGGLVADGDDLIQGVLGAGTSVQRVLLAVALLQNVGVVGEAMHQAVIAAFVTSLQGGVTDAHQHAIADLKSIAGPALITALAEVLSDHDLSTQQASVQLLGMIGDHAAAVVLTRLLTQDTLTSLVADTLVRLGKTAAEALVTAMWTEKAAMRKPAVEVLTRIGGAAVDTLIVALGHTDGFVSLLAEDALVRIGGVALGPLIAALHHADRGVRIEAAAALGRVGDDRAVDSLIVALRDADSRVRRAAAAALDRLGDDRAVDPLIAALGDADSSVRGVAAEALGRLGNDRAVDPLIAALHDTHGFVRGAAAEALDRLGDDRAVDPLIMTLHDTHGFVRRAAAEALGQLGDDRAVDPLIAALGDADSSVRGVAAEALGRLGNDRAVDPLIAALGDADWDVRKIAQNTLIHMGSMSVDPLIAALHDTYWFVRGADAWFVRRAAAEALGQLGDDRAVEPLIVALGDADSSVRGVAAKALGRLGDRRAVDPLIVTLHDTDGFVRGVAAEALGQLGDGRAVEPLIVARDDEDAWVRARVETALQRIQEILQST